MLTLNPSAPLGTPSALAFLLASTPIVVTPPVTTGGTLLYCTLPLQIAQAGNPGVGITRIDWKQYQTSPMLALCLIDANGTPVNVVGATVRLRLAPRYGGTGSSILETMTILYGAGGQVSYTFADADVAVAGAFSLEVEVTFGNGAYMYFGAILLEINRSLGGPL